MSSDVAVRVEGLSKQYRLGALRAGSTTLRETISTWVRRRESREDRILWALRDVSFELRTGEAFGVIGKNGSGKSTLLKILSRITPPTKGFAKLRGRVGSLLEVGTGFHPELTGRENVFLSGRLLGLRRNEIRSKFDEIVAFAGIGRQIDTPVKRYSSGQYARLAFAVAAFLEPEILIVDEVLAVGDAEFQQRCIGRMKNVAQMGRTILFVSHNMDAVTSLCSRAILLREGRVEADGPARDVVLKYSAASASQHVVRWRGEAGDDDVRLLATSVSTSDRDGVLCTDSPIEIEFVAEVRAPVLGLICAVELYSGTEKLLAYSAYDDDRSPPADEVAPGRIARRMVIPPNTLAAGSYEVRFDFGIHNRRRIVDGSGTLAFHIENVAGLGRRFLTPRTQGLLRPAWTWDILQPDRVEALLGGPQGTFSPADS
jgi:lipopolysaccharide transport system ATP-binding protein